LQARVAANALELARDGLPRQPFYLTGQVGGQSVSVHAEGERVILTADGSRREVDLTPPPAPPRAQELPAVVCPAGVLTANVADEEPPAPASSPLDHALPAVHAALATPAEGAGISAPAAANLPPSTPSTTPPPTHGGTS